jgi:hypothetical protein
VTLAMAPTAVHQTWLDGEQRLRIAEGVTKDLTLAEP